MGKLLRKVTGRAVGRYRAMGIQMVISLSFTAVAIVGMVFMGMSLLDVYKRQILWWSRVPKTNILWEVACLSIQN